MFELIGFCLLKEYRYEKAFMFVGDGRNGKGKTINLIKRFLGSQNYSSVPLEQMNSNSSAICEMFGKLVNLAGDIANTGLKETGILKGLCGRDNVNAKRKYLNDLSFENYAKLIFAANELPRVYDFSRGFWSSWILLDFPYTFLLGKEYEENKSDTMVKLADVSIIDKITTKEELTGLLNLALDGLGRLIKNKGFSYTKGTGEVKTMWVRKSDSFTSFCLDHIEESEGSIITKKVLRSFFHKFCKTYKLKGTSDKSIKVTLESMFGVSDERLDGYGGEWAWINIKIKEKTDNE
jgi:putative DNA primase/helicase